MANRQRVFGAVCLSLFLAAFISFTPQDTKDINYPQNGAKDFITRWIEQTASIPQVDDRGACLQRALGAVKRCVLSALQKRDNYVWYKLHTVITQCSSTFLRAPLKLVNTKTDKLFIRHRNYTSSNKDCVVVTIGIGNETIFEETVKTLYPPSCKFYGADPVPEMSEAFQRLGETFHYAVDDSFGTKRLQTLSTDGEYKWRIMETVPFHHFIDELVKAPHIDFLAMDSEGSEYRILPQLAALQTKTNICQIALELHGPLQKRNASLTHEVFNRLIANFFDRSPFVPIGAYAPGNHHRFTVFNMDSPFCLNRYQLYCQPFH